ncbi:peptide deformylase [Ilyobacter polytropus]|uniref:Peptide deformylase n=1 Tax=Ilyobacter polytropus (strain ATCC 51220 / DSM 2926 / LMG 16218 / CuHBu1) TaxID=572544 RepID=E3H6U1_ILYPC|nr:peptide deformylase [Ilyobacter polytropus]ADO82460.1 peptide deformylase [Ilyobacter polytropus DSM 2926]
MIYDIRTYGDPVLRKEALPVEDVNDEIREIIDSMVESMHEAGGVGLAAPQIGVSKRIFVIDIEDGKIRKVINPEFLEFSKEIVEHEEGCLSVPGVYKKVKRPARVKIKYTNENGEKVIEEAEGLLSRAFQHEADHLDATLFVDKLSPVAKRMVSKKLQALKKETEKKDIK